MTQANCPVCGNQLQLADLSVAHYCDTCGAMLEPEQLQGAIALHAAPQDLTPLAEEDSAGQGAAQPELLQAFRSQFEEQQIAVPASWTARLQRLATEAETSRRHATIIFVDLRGYTRLSRVLAEHDTDALRQWFYGVCTRCVERHGGFVIQLLGDAAYAAFGAPWAFERDTESALLCLLDIRDEVRRHGSIGGEQLEIRAGATSGVINVRLTEEHGRPRPDLFGSPVNLAARLEAQAETGEIAISDTLAEQVRGLFDLEPRPAFTPKNYGQEVTPYVVLAHKGSEAARRRHDLPFIGRQRELDTLRGWMATAERGGFVAARLETEAGLGKTRLALEAFRGADASVIQTHRIAVEPHHRHVLLAPFLALLRQLAGHPGEAAGNASVVRPETVLEDLRKALPEVEDSVIPTLGYLLGAMPYREQLRAMPTAHLREQVVMALLRTIAAAARQRPLALFIDDSQWCDQLSMLVITRLVEAKPAGVLLLMAGRGAEAMREGFEDTASGTVPKLALRQEAGWEVLELPPLGTEDCRALLAHLVDPETLHPLLRERLLTDSGGMPLYLIEIGRELAETEQSVSSKRLTQRLLDGVPLEGKAAMIDLLQARIDRLSAARRAVLQCGAVLGRRFSYGVLADYKDLGKDLLEELLALKSLQMLQDETLPDDLEFMFTPNALRDVVYQMLTGPQRERLHGVLAGLLEKRFADRLDSLAVPLAFHYVRANQLAKARPYVRKAAQQAIGLGAPQEAYGIVLEALERSREERESGERLSLQQTALLEELAGRAARSMGDYRQALSHFDAWHELAVTLGNPLWQSGARYQRAVVLFEQGNLAEAEALLASLVAETKGVPPPQAMAWRKTLASVRFRQGRYQEAVDLNLAVAKDSTPVPLYNSLKGDAWNNAALALRMLGRLDEAADAHRRAREAYREAGLVMGEVIALNNLGIVAEKQGDFAQAAERYAEAQREAERLGYIHLLSAVACNRANVALVLHRWEEAEAQAARSLHYARLIGHTNSQILALQNLSLALDGMGRCGEAIGHGEQTLQLIRESGESGSLPEASLNQAWILARCGRVAEARNLLNQMGDVPPALNDMAETMKGLVAVQEGKAHEAPLFQRGRLAADGARLTPESFLRRLDAAEWLARRGALPAEQPEELQALRREFTQRLVGV